ncbi:MAG: hypothetical protein AB8F26_04685 [Phycisphaerales bacterium]
MNDGTVIMDSRSCRGCGYELRGLRTGRNCPECGELIRSRPKTFNAREGTLSDADPAYVELLRWGFVLMSVGIGVAIFSVFAGIRNELMGSGLSVLASGAWCGGIWIVSRPRPPVFAELNEAVLDNPRMQLLIRACGAVWVAYALISAAHGALASAGPGGAAGGAAVAAPGLLENVLLGLKVVIGLGAYLSLIPMCIFVGDMAFWMSNDSGGWRLRAAAWVMAVFGVISIVMGGLSAVGMSYLALFGFFASILVFGAAVVFGWSVLECARMASFVLSYQENVHGRTERITKRLMDQTENGGTVAGDMDCRGCGYNLRGLPNGGQCPECGTSYADVTPMPIRPDRVRSPEEDAPIDLDESGELLPIIARTPSINPDARAESLGGHRQQIPPIDDDKPIPLAMGTGSFPDPGEDLPEDLQDEDGSDGSALADADGAVDDGSIPFADDAEFPDDRTV